MPGIYGRITQPGVNQDQDNAGCLPDYVLQSTPVSNKTRNLDKSQPFSVIISIIESTKIRKIQLVREKAGFHGQVVKLTNHP